MADKAGISLREAALMIILEIIEEGRQSHIVINQKLNAYKELDKRDRAAISKICLGTIENLIAIDYEIEKYSKIKINKMKPIVRNLLRISVYQICYLSNIPDFAVCNEAVIIIKKRKLNGLTGFVNGVLRNIARNKEAFNTFSDSISVVRKLSIMYSIPEWIIEEWINRFGFDISCDIFRTFHEEKPLSVRINLSRISKNELLKLLKEENVRVCEMGIFDDMLYLYDIDSLEKLNSFKNGYYQVQDVSSSLVSRTAGIKCGNYIIDTCAAPGGKAMHAADILFMSKTPICDKEEDNRLTGYVSARDITDSKLILMKSNFDRCGFSNIEVLKADALSLRKEDIGKADIVIADLPCSGLGTIRRKPDIKYKMTKEKQKELAALQKNILKTVSQYVKKDGVLIYSTCTISIDENENNYKFIIDELGFKADSLNPYIPKELHSSTTNNGYLQIIPNTLGYDGFFISRAINKSNKVIAINKNN